MSRNQDNRRNDGARYDRGQDERGRYGQGQDERERYGQDRDERERSDRGRDQHGRSDRGRDQRERFDRGRGGQGGRYDDRARSRSPQRGGSNARGRVGGSRGDSRGSTRGRGGLDGIASNNSMSALPPLPHSTPIPEETGAKVPYAEHVSRGTIGKQIMVLANHHEIQYLPVVKIYHYDLRFRVPETSQAKGSDKVTANQMARVLLNTTLVQFLGKHFVFDGVSIGFSPTELFPVGAFRSTAISLGVRKDDKPNEVEVQIRNAGSLDMSGLVNYLKKGRIELNPTGKPDVEIMFKWLNALFRDDPARRMVSRPNSNAFFKRSSENSLPLASTGGLLEAVRGIYQTVVLRFSRLTVCVDTVTTPHWTPDLTLIDCVCALAGERSNQNLEQRFLSNPDHFFQACSMLLGCFFNVRHLDANKNATKIKFLSWSGQDALSTNFDERFHDGTTRSTSVADYFLRKYDIRLLYPALPLVNSRNGAIPLELCYTVSGEIYRGVLHGPDFIKFATTSAYVRRQQINANLRLLAWHQNATLRAHGVSVNPNMTQVRGVVLEAPQLVYGSDTMTPQDGSWNLRGHRFLRPGTIRSWALISFIPQVDRLETLGYEIIKSFRAVGMSVPSSPPSILVGNPQGDMGSIFYNAINKAEQDFGRQPDLIIVVLKTSSIPVYRAVKQALEIGHGIASQVMLAEKVFKDRGQPQYLANISMKVNVKLGGKNWTVNQPLFQQSRWMLIGGDVSSPSPSALKLDPPPPSTAALCATIDRDCTSYIGNATMQQSTETNTIVHARSMFNDLLARYKTENNGQMPEHIIFYRDGASESEFDSIIAKEGRELHQLCQGSGTKITLIVGIKRHHARFFPEGDMATKLGNVPTGTVVENSSSRNDSYLIPHRDLIGTKRPTRYVSIIDENKLSADEFHEVIYLLSYTYARATTSVAVVPPIYYAHQICERARLHLQDTQDGNQLLPQVHDNLKATMYWQ